MTRVINLKNIPYKEHGDKLEVKLKNYNWEVFYHKEVAINDKKAISKIVEDLDNYGIDLKKPKKKLDTSWFG